MLIDWVDSIRREYQSIVTTSEMYEQDMRKSLLIKKGASFDKLHEECLVKIQRIKQKNDFMQKQVGTELEDDIKLEIRKQKNFLMSEIKQIKQLMSEMETRFKDPESRNKLKGIKSQAQKQIERNRVIMKDFINKSFCRSGGSNDDDDMHQYMDGGQISYDQFDDRNGNGNRNGNRNGNGNGNHHFDRKQQQKESLMTEKEDEIDIDYELERKMLREKKQMLNSVEESTENINNIMNDMAVMVDQQGEGLEVITDELMKANQNVRAANDNMETAEKYQKKSKKKYIIFALIIVLAVGAVLGLVFILK